MLSLPPRSGFAAPLLVIIFTLCSCSSLKHNKSPLLTEMQQMGKRCLEALGDNTEQPYPTELFDSLQALIATAEEQERLFTKTNNGYYHLSYLYFLEANHLEVGGDHLAAVDRLHRSIDCLMQPNSIPEVYDSLRQGDAMNALHISYLRVGEIVKAEEYALGARAIYPKDSLDRRALIQLNLGRLYAYQGKLDRAKKALKDGQDLLERPGAGHLDSIYSVNGLMTLCKIQLIEMATKGGTAITAAEREALTKDVKSFLSRKSWFREDEIGYQWAVTVQELVNQYLASPPEAIDDRLLVQQLLTDAGQSLSQGALSISTYYMAMHEMNQADWSARNGQAQEGTTAARSAWGRLGCQLQSDFTLSFDPNVSYLEPNMIYVSYARFLQEVFELPRQASAYQKAMSSMFKVMEARRVTQDRDVRTQYLFEGHSEAIKIGIQAALIPGTDPKAAIAQVLYLSEARRAQSLNTSSLSTNLAAQKDQEIAGWLIRDRELRVRLRKIRVVASYTDDLSQRASLDAQYIEIVRERQRFHNFLQEKRNGRLLYQELLSATTPTASDLQQALQPGQALVVLTDAKETIATVVLTQDQQWIHESPPIKQWQSDLEHYRFGLEKQTSYTQYFSAAHAVYKALLQPALSQLPPDVRQLIIVRDGRLLDLSLEALLTRPWEGTADYRNAPYLIRDYTMHYNYSLGAFLHSASRPILNTAEDKLGVFTAKYRRGRSKSPCVAQRPLKYLPKLEQQLTKLMPVKRLPNKRRQLTTALERYALLLLCVHGEANDDNPIYSSIHLGALKGGGSCQLTLAEIAVLKLPGSDIVLASCETEAGRIFPGAGVISIARSFYIAGANSLVANLRKVKEEPTALQLRYYFEGIAAGLPKAEALQRAKLQLLEKEEDRPMPPYLWANTILLGNGD